MFGNYAGQAGTSPLPALPAPGHGRQGGRQAGRVAGQAGWERHRSGGCGSDAAARRVRPRPGQWHRLAIALWRSRAAAPAPPPAAVGEPRTLRFLWRFALFRGCLGCVFFTFLLFLFFSPRSLPASHSAAQPSPLLSSPGPAAGSRDTASVAECRRAAPPPFRGHRRRSPPSSARQPVSRDRSVAGTNRDVRRVAPSGRSSENGKEK